MLLEEFLLDFSYTIPMSFKYFSKKTINPAFTSKLPLLALVATAFLFVVNNSTVRLLDNSFTPLSQVFWRMVLASLFAYFFFRRHINVQRIGRAAPRQLVLLVSLGIISGGIATIFRTFGFLNTTLVNVQFIDLLAPAVVYVYSLLLLKERFNWKLLGLTIVSVYGVLMVATNSFIPTINNYGRGELFATLAVMTTSLGFIIRKLLTYSFNAAEISWTSFIFSAFFLLGMIVVTKSPFINNFQVSVLGVLVLNSLLTCIGIFLLNYAMGYVSPTLGSQVNQLKIIFTLAIGFVFFKELPTIIGLIGGILVAAAIYCLHRLNTQPKKL